MHEPAPWQWHPADSLLAALRDYRRHREGRGGLSVLGRKFARLRHRFWSVMTASDIQPGAQLGEGVRLPHPTGVVIHRNAVVGPRCMLMQQVTLGQLADGAAPVLGADVYVGAGARILGGVTIGDGARIGANAVVLKDVPPGCTAVGVPARIHRPAAAEWPEAANG